MIVKNRVCPHRPICRIRTVAPYGIFRSWSDDSQDVAASDFNLLHSKRDPRPR